MAEGSAAMNATQSSSSPIISNVTIRDGEAAVRLVNGRDGLDGPGRATPERDFVTLAEDSSQSLALSAAVRVDKRKSLM